MEPNACAHCGAPLRPAAGYCRACDTPVEGAQSGRLSVAEPVPVAPDRRRRRLAVTGAVALLALVGTMGYGALHLADARHAATAAEAAADARHAVVLLVRAESGQAGACGASMPYLDGQHADLRQDCLALVGTDPGLRLAHVRLGTPALHAGVGTVHVTGTVTDDSGTRSYSRTLGLVDQGGHWLVRWDGRRLV